MNKYHTLVLFIICVCKSRKHGSETYAKRKRYFIERENNKITFTQNII